MDWTYLDGKVEEEDKMQKYIKLFGAIIIFFVFTGCEGKSIDDIISSIFNPVPEVARGYDKVKWGISPDDVRKTYNIGNDVNLYQVDRDDSENVTRLRQDNISESITSRVFMFHDNKLYRVWVTYSGNINHDDISSALTERYGASVLETKPSVQIITGTQRVPRTMRIPLPRVGGLTGSGSSGYSMQPFTYYEDVQTSTTKNVTNYSKYFNQYSPNIEVELQYGETWSTQVCYTWKIEHDKFKGALNVEL
jgi:uncharacterized lipoprotein YajG